MVANYTMEIRQMIDNPLIGLFTFDYDFYSDNPKDKEAFEKLFIQWYYFREIGFETPERFKLKLQAKLNVIMHYYRQLAMTEWDKVRSVEEMMTSKNLKETTEHKQSIEGSNESESNASSSSHQSDNTNQSSTSSGSSTSSSSTNDKQSNLADGVAQASLTSGYLTSVSESTNNSDATISSNDTNNVTNASQGTAEQNGKTSGSNKQELTESITFSSVGDIGIQTPAYAITEWRKVLININQLIIEECNDLFMKLY